MEYEEVKLWYLTLFGISRVFVCSCKTMVLVAYGMLDLSFMLTFNKYNYLKPVAEAYR